jgi:hypothetical protein
MKEDGEVAEMRSDVTELEGCKIVKVVWLLEGVPRFIVKCEDGCYEYDPPIPCMDYPDYLTEIKC